MPAVALRIVSLVGLALAVRATPAIAELRVYEARHRPAAELLPLARTALGGEGAATVDARTQTLVLTGPGAALTRTLELLRSMDRRLRTVVLRYVSVGHEEMEAAGLRVEWSVELGDARIGTLPAGARLALGFEVAHAAATPRLAATLRLLEGHRGRLA